MNPISISSRSGNPAAGTAGPPTIVEHGRDLFVLFDLCRLVGPIALTPGSPDLPQLPRGLERAARWPAAAHERDVARHSVRSSLQGRRCATIHRLVRACRLRDVSSRRDVCIRASTSRPHNPSRPSDRKRSPWSRWDLSALPRSRPCGRGLESGRDGGRRVAKRELWQARRRDHGSGWKRDSLRRTNPLVGVGVSSCRTVRRATRIVDDGTHGSQK